MDDHEKIVSPTAIPRTSWDHFLRMCFWTLVVPAVSLILLSFMSWFIWMRLKWLTPDRYEREKLVFKRGESLSMGWVWPLLKCLSPSATVAGYAASVRISHPKGMTIEWSIIRWSHCHSVRWWQCPARCHHCGAGSWWSHWGRWVGVGAGPVGGVRVKGNTRP